MHVQVPFKKKQKTFPHSTTSTGVLGAARLIRRWGLVVIVGEKTVGRHVDHNNGGNSRSSVGRDKGRAKDFFFESQEGEGTPLKLSQGPRPTRSRRANTNTHKMLTSNKFIFWGGRGGIHAPSHPRTVSSRKRDRIHPADMKTRERLRQFNARMKEKVWVKTYPELKRFVPVCATPITSST